MNIILIMIATAAIFFIGIRVGYNMGLKEYKTFSTGPKIQKLKRTIPFTKEYKEEQKEKEEIIRLNKIMNNIDNFNGKKEGQVDVD